MRTVAPGKRRICPSTTTRSPGLNVSGSTTNLPADWNARPETVETQGIGDEWVARRDTPVLAVPSVVVPSELRFEREYLNYLFNPQHPDFGAAVEVGELRALDWDPRFKGR